MPGRGLAAEIPDPPHHLRANDDHRDHRRGNR